MDSVQDSHTQRMPEASALRDAGNWNPKHLLSSQGEDGGAQRLSQEQDTEETD